MFTVDEGLLMATLDKDLNAEAIRRECAFIHSNGQVFGECNEEKAD